MENLINENQKVIEDYRNQENLKIQPLQLRNVRLFLIQNENLTDLQEDLTYLSKFAQKAFMLMDDENRPDGQYLHDIVNNIECFQDELKFDIETYQKSKGDKTTIPEAVFPENHNEETERLEKEVSMLNREIGGLEYLLENYLKNRMFYEQMKRIVTDYTNGQKTEQETINGFLSSIKEHWNVCPPENDFFEQLEHNALFMAMANMVAVNYRSGLKTKEETEKEFIEYTQRFWKFSERPVKNEVD
ncbi:MAG: hypothetical protein JXR61_01620 [Prolixibacteraceae bacterium]|nr:hypothetical protein [Prolixibacteraceae bacterium]